MDSSGGDFDKLQTESKGRVGKFKSSFFMNEFSLR